MTKFKNIFKKKSLFKKNDKLNKPEVYDGRRIDETRSMSISTQFSNVNPSIYDHIADYVIAKTKAAEYARENPGLDQGQKNQQPNGALGVNNEFDDVCSHDSFASTHISKDKTEAVAVNVDDQGAVNENAPRVFPVNNIPPTHMTLKNETPVQENADKFQNAEQLDVVPEVRQESPEIYPKREISVKTSTASTHGISVDMNYCEDHQKGNMNIVSRRGSDSETHPAKQTAKNDQSPLDVCSTSASDTGEGPSSEPLRASYMRPYSTLRRSGRNLGESLNKDKWTKHSSVVYLQEKYKSLEELRYMEDSILKEIQEEQMKGILKESQTKSSSTISKKFGRHESIPFFANYNLPNYPMNYAYYNQNIQAVPKVSQPLVQGPMFMPPNGYIRDQQGYPMCYNIHPEAAHPAPVNTQHPEKVHEEAPSPQTLPVQGTEQLKAAPHPCMFVCDSIYPILPNGRIMPPQTFAIPGAPVLYNYAQPIPQPIAYPQDQGVVPGTIYQPPGAYPPVYQCFQNPNSGAPPPDKQ